MESGALAMGPHIPLFSFVTFSDLLKALVEFEFSLSKLYSCFSMEEW